MAVYKGALNFLVSEQQKRGKVPTWIWVFDTIPDYFNLYKLVGAAALRDGTISDSPKWISPGPKDIQVVENIAKYGSQKISRLVEIPFPIRRNGKLSFEKKPVPFLDGVVDTFRARKAVFNTPITLRGMHNRGFSLSDRVKLRIGMSIVSQCFFNEIKGKSSISKLIDSAIHSQYRTKNKFILG